MWLGIGFGSLLWVGASILMSLWTAWFGVALMRSPAIGAVDEPPRARP